MNFGVIAQKINQSINSKSTTLKMKPMAKAFTKSKKKEIAPPLCCFSLNEEIKGTANRVIRKGIPHNND